MSTLKDLMQHMKDEADDYATCSKMNPTGSIVGAVIAPSGETTDEGIARAARLRILGVDSCRELDEREDGDE